MMSHGYLPQNHRAAVKPPVYQTSTFVFESAEQGKAFFAEAYGLEESPGDDPGYIYSRLSNPTQDILERRLTVWDGADDCAIFSSGMAAITTVFMEFLKPGDVLLHGTPVYGGTDHFINEFLPAHGIQTIGFRATMSQEEIERLIIDEGVGHKLAMIFIETPANPTNDLIDIRMCAHLAKTFQQYGNDRQIKTVVDNTYMGPLWQQPLKHGADLVVYSATKYIGGHSDLIAGAVLGGDEDMARIKTLRTFLGNISAPWTNWLLLRSLETMKLRMDQQCANARAIAEFLTRRPEVIKVYYPGLFKPGSAQAAIYDRQCEGPGAMIAFELKGGEEQAFQFLNHLKLVRLAVSLGGTESLAEHPRTMTHAGLSEDHLDDIGVSSGLVRLSVGIENVSDLINELERSFDAVSMPGVDHTRPVHRERVGVM